MNATGEDGMKKVVKRVLVVLLCLVLLVVGLGALTLYKNFNPSAPTVREEGIRVACVGDSITFGSGILLRRWTEDSFPKELGVLLGPDYQVLNYGLSGRTATRTGDRPYWDDDFFAISQDIAPDIVIIMLGSNDSKPYNWDAEVYRADLSALVDSYIQLPNRPDVYLLAPPAAFVREGKEAVVYDIDAEVIRDEIRGIVTEVGQAAGIPVIDLYAATQAHPEYFSDGVHPTAEGNKALARVLYSAIWG